MNSISWDGGRALCWLENHPHWCGLDPIELAAEGGSRKVVKSNYHRSRFRDACHDSWTNLRLSPMFGCICPNNHMKKRCDRIFNIVNHNPCVGKFRLATVTFVTATETTTATTAIITTIKTTTSNNTNNWEKNKHKAKLKLWESWNNIY